MLDRTDVAILKILSNDASLTAREISRRLERQKIVMTERGVRKRISALRMDKIIKKTTILMVDDVAGRRVKRVVLVKFRNIRHLAKRLDDYLRYVEEAPYCTLAMKTRGDLDWMHYKCFPSKLLADHEDIIFRSIFGDIMEEYRQYDVETIKSDHMTIIDQEEIEAYLKKFT